MKNKFRMLVLLILACFVAGLFVRGQDESPNQLEHPMKKLEFLIGNWEGKGWIKTPEGERREFSVIEKVEPRLGGKVLFFEGRGYGADDSGAEVLGHDALGIFFYDEVSGTFQFDTFESRRGHVLADAEVADDSILWGFQRPGNVKILFTISLNESGQWVETGEFSLPGRQRQQFLHMTLNRVE